MLSRKNPYLIYPPLYVLVEILRGWGDLGFTGARASDALFVYHHIVFLASIFGELGLSFLVILVNVFLWKFFKKKDWQKVLLVISLIHVSWTFFPKAVLVPNKENSFEFWIYQTNEDAEEKYRMSTMEKLKNLPKKDGLIVTPEAYITVFISKKPQIEGDVLLGTLFREGRRRYNSALLINDKVERYDKVRLFPFAEFLPYPKVFSILKFLRGFSYYNRGKGYHTLTYHDKKIGVLICFESYFEEGALKYSKDADFIVIMTNDAWFRYDIALWNHFAKAVFRAAESGRWVVQVANKGISGVIDDYGRIRKILPVGKTSLEKIRVGKPHPTIYPKLRKVLFFVPIALLILGIFSESR
jgi:apolipoprotein N-acyltransferase